MTIGEKIRFYRERAGMTQEKLADVLGTTKQTIHKYETGIITNIPMEKIAAMGAWFQINPSLLPGWVEPESPATLGEASAEDVLRQYFITRFGREPNEKDLKALDSFADYYIENLKKD